MITTKFRSTVKSRSGILEHLNGTILICVCIYIFVIYYEILKNISMRLFHLNKTSLIYEKDVLRINYPKSLFFFNEMKRDTNHKFIENLINN